ncbi:hypothetical protein C0J52_21906 [Blattella germanica]|nr:hypothetical protein C0J52_21906 [Blattella germanica]
MSNTKIDQLGIDPKTVRLWVNKGDGNVNDSKRVGRPTKLTPNTKNKIRNLVKDKIGIGTRAVTKRLNFSDDYQQSQKTIGRTTVDDFIRRHSWGKHAYVQPTKPMLSDKNIVDRQAFCERIMSDGFCDANPEHFLLFGMTWPGNSSDLNSV